MISVVMGIHRFDDYVKDAINSILNQTFKDFEFIIVANGSEAQNVISLIQNLFPNENRIIYLATQIGQLAHALNIGIDAAKYDYIARMDADDISHPERLEKQYQYLIDNNLDMIGSDINLIDENGKHLGFREYPKGTEISKKIIFKSCFCHPSILMKKSIFFKTRGYNAGFNSEDYDLWLRMNRIGVKWDNVNESLLDYRIHSLASQGRLLGYAEVAGYSLREFILNKSVIGMCSVVINFIKALVRPDCSKTSN